VTQVTDLGRNRRADSGLKNRRPPMNQLSMTGEYPAVDRDRAGPPEATRSPSGEMIRKAWEDRIPLTGPAVWEAIGMSLAGIGIAGIILVIIISIVT
jgi:hypothetical protein